MENNTILLVLLILFFIILLTYMFLSSKDNFLTYTFESALPSPNYILDPLLQQDYIKRQIFEDSSSFPVNYPPSSYPPSSYPSYPPYYPPKSYRPPSPSYPPSSSVNLYERPDRYDIVYNIDNKYSVITEEPQYIEIGYLIKNKHKKEKNPMDFTFKLFGKKNFRDKFTYLASNDYINGKLQVFNKNGYELNNGDVVNVDGIKGKYIVKLYYI